MKILDIWCGEKEIVALVNYLKGEKMDTNNRVKLKDIAILKILWNLRTYTVNECLMKIRNSNDLKFLLSMAGIWFFVRITVFILFSIHLFSLLGRIFRLVLG